MAEDPNVYEYDSIYDDMHHKQKEKTIKEKNKDKGKVREGFS